MSRRYLKTLEEHGPANIVGRYAIVYQGEEPLAAIAAQRVTINGNQVDAGSSASSSRKGKVIANLVHPFRELSQEMLVCGNLLSWGDHGIAISPKADKSIFRGIAETLYRMRRSDTVLGKADLVMIKDILPGHEAHATDLKNYSYRRLETEPNMVLSIKPSWTTFEDYLGALTSSYRKNARKIAKDVDAAGIAIRRISPSAKDAPILHALYKQVHASASVRLYTIAESFIPALAQAFENDFICTAAYRNDQMVGFVTTLKDNQTAMGYYVGFDRAANAEAPIYFRLLQAAVEDAISLRCSRLSLGRTALDPKARLGAKPEPMSIYMRHRVPMLNLIVRAALKGVHHDEAPERDPFKTEK